MDNYISDVILLLVVSILVVVIVRMIIKYYYITHYDKSSEIIYSTNPDANKVLKYLHDSIEDNPYIVIFKIKLTKDYTKEMIDEIVSNGYKVVILSRRELVINKNYK